MDRTVGGKFRDYFRDLAIDSGGDIYAVGYTSSSDGDISDGNTGGADAWIVKFDQQELDEELWSNLVYGGCSEFCVISLDCPETKRNDT